MRLFYLSFLLSIVFFTLLSFHSTPSKELSSFREKCSPQTASLLPISVYPQIQQDEQGNSVSVWKDGNSLYSSILYKDKVEWTAPTIIAKSKFLINNVHLVSNHQGTFFLSWQEFGEKQEAIVMTAFLPISKGLWTTPRAVSPFGLLITSSAIAVNSSGQILVVWEENTSAIHVIKAVWYLPENGWSTPQQISRTDQFSIHPSVILDEQGRGLVNWLRKSTDHYVVEALILPSTGEFIAPVDLGIIK